MKTKVALTAIYWLSLLGILFSGYLSYSEMFLKVCVFGGGCSNIAGLPACVYGFGMFIVIFVLSILGIRGK
jgi:uncharacterized membrane protein